MARVGTFLGYGVLVLLLLLMCAITFTIGWRPFIGPRARALTNRRFESTPERLARGKYLVEGVNGCLGCHSDADYDKPGMPPKAGMEGAGHNWTPDGLPWLTAPNLTPDPDTGIGRWSDDALARAIREGIGNEGRALFPIMPYQMYRNMSDDDLAAVIVYIRSLKPVRRELPKSAVPFPVNHFINAAPRPVDAPIPAPNRSDRVSYGHYMVQMSACTDCHTPMDDHGQPIPGMDFAGGNTFTAPGKSAASANITPDPSGIPYYDENLFLEMMRTGKVRARQISDIMPWAYYGKQTDDDLKAMFAYLKTLKPAQHRVDNSKPPTKCPRCGLTHGAGNENGK